MAARVDPEELDPYYDLVEYMLEVTPIPPRMRFPNGRSV